MVLVVKKRYPAPIRRTKDTHHKLPQRVYKREQRMQSIRRMTTGLLVLCLLAMATGIGYTWYMGRHKTALADQPAPAKSVRPVFRPLKVASDAPIGVATQTFTSDVKRGDNASISVRTNPEADCIISVKYGSILAQDSGLVGKKADEFGVASWAWTISPSAPKGAWPVQVSCKNKKNSAVVIVNLVVGS
jgi:hypothetical protein